MFLAVRRLALPLCVCSALPLFACSSDIEPTRPLDPDTPVDRQSKATVRGSIQLEEGANPAVATLTLLPVNRQATPSEDGTFSIGEVTPGTYTIDVSAPGFVSVSSGEFTVAAGEDILLGVMQLRLTRVTVRGSVSVEARDNAGGVAISLASTAPPPGDSVGQALRPTQEDPDPVLVSRRFGTLSSADGEWQIDGVPEGWYLATATLPDHTTYCVSLVQVTIQAGQDAVTIEEMRLAPASGVVRIVDEDGATLPATNAAEVDVSLLVFGVAEMRTGLDAAALEAASYEPFLSNLQGVEVAPAGTPEGPVQLLAQFKDACGIESQVYRAEVLFDQTAPVLGDARLDDGRGFVTDPQGLSTLFVEAEDAVSGLSRLHVEVGGESIFGEDGTEFARQLTLNLGEDEGDKSVSVVLEDVAGNRSEAAALSAIKDTLAPELGDPALRILEAQAGLVTGIAVTLELQIGGEPVEVAVRNTSGTEAGPWQPYAALLPWNLAAGPDGPREVFVRARDAAGNATDELRVEVELDTTAPAAERFALASESIFVNTREVTLEVQTEGVSSFQIAESLDFPGAEWLDVSVAEGGSYVYELANEDGPRTLFARYRDLAGNISGILRAPVVLDRVAPPRPAVRIDNGSELTNDASGQVQLRIDASDALSGLLGMGVVWGDAPAEPGCDVDYQAEPPVSTVNVPAADGEKTVHVVVCDRAGNISVSDSATITLDRQAPVVGDPAINFSGAEEGVIHALQVELRFTVEEAAELKVWNLPGEAPALWSKFDSKRLHTLEPGVDGVATVAALFRDAATNEAEQVTAEVTVDLTGRVFGRIAPDIEIDVTEFELRIDEIVATPEANGDFDIAGVPEGTHTLSVSHPRFRPLRRQLRIEAGRSVGLGDLPAQALRGEVRGTVTLAGESLYGGTEIVLENAAGNAVVTTATSFDGRFRFTSVPVGELVLVARRAGFSTRRRAGVVVEADQITTIESLVLPREQGEVIVGDGSGFSATPDVTLDFAIPGDAVSVRFVEVGVGILGEQPYVQHPPQDAHTLSLSEGDGEKFVEAQYEDADGDVSQIMEARVVVDTAAPEALSLLINGGAIATNDQSGLVRIELLARDALSGVPQIVFDEVGPGGETDGEPQPWDGLPFDFGLSDVEGPHSLFVRFIDGAGNESETLTADIELDREAPSFGTPAITVVEAEGGIVFRTEVTLRFDVTGATQMKVWNTPGDPPEEFEPFEALRLHLLEPGAGGTATVAALFRDAAGNETPELSTAVSVDRTGGVSGQLVPDEAPADLDEFTVSAGGQNANPASNGSFTLGGIDEGEQTLTVTHPRFATLSVPVRVVAGETLELGDLRPLVLRGAVAGEVRLAGSTDHSGVVVSLSGRLETATTGFDGVYRLAAVPVGTYTLTARRAGFSSTQRENIEIAADADTVVPTIVLAPEDGTLVIGDGGEFTRTQDVVLNFDLPGDAVSIRFVEQGVTELSDADYVVHPPAVGDHTLTLSEGDEPKVILAQYEDADGDVSQIIAGRVVLDTTAPEAVSIEVDGGAAFTTDPSRRVELSPVGEDALSGIAFVIFGEGDPDPEAGIREPWRNRPVSLTLADSDGERTLFAFFEDNAGNLSAALRTTITLDRLPPSIDSISVTGVIADGVESTTLSGTPNVRVALSSQDAHTMEVGEDALLAAARPVPYEPLFDWSFGGGDGPKRLYVRVFDAAGNSSGAPAALDPPIVLDREPPRAPAVIIAGGDALTNASAPTHRVPVTVSAREATQYAIATEPFGDSPVWLDMDGDVVATTVDLPTEDGVKTVYALFRDAAGNAIEALPDDIVLDTQAPLDARVVISSRSPDDADGEETTFALTVALRITGRDAVRMRVACDGTFDAEPEVAYASSFTCVLPPGEGEKEVCARLFDAAGNFSDDCDTIRFLENTAPTFVGVPTLLQVVEGEKYLFGVCADDAQDDAVSIEAGLLPENAVLSPDETCRTQSDGRCADVCESCCEGATVQTFAFSPNFDQGGNQIGLSLPSVVEFQASDGRVSSRHLVQLNIQHLDREPLMQVSPPGGVFPVFAGRTIQLGVFAEDPDGDALRLFAGPELLGLELSTELGRRGRPVEGTLSYTPPRGVVGLQHVVIRAIEQEDSSVFAQQTVIFDVRPAPARLLRPTPEIAFDGAAKSSAVGDLNDDGVLDLVVLLESFTGGGQDRVAVFLGLSDNVDFGEPDTVPTGGLAPPYYETLSGAYSRVEIGDLNGDGLGDLILSTPAATGAIAGFELSTIDGGFAPWPLVNVVGVRWDLLPWYLDDDDAVDIVLSGSNVFGVRGAHGLGDANFELPATLNASGSIFAGDFVDAADLTGDGRPEVINMQRSGDYSVSIFDALSRTDQDVRSIERGVDNVEVVAMDFGDLNADGREDMVLATTTGILAFLSAGDGSFEPTPWRFRFPGGMRNIWVRDLGHDGADIIANTTDGQLFVFEQPADLLVDNRLGLTRAQPGIGSPADIEVADLDGEGTPDLILADAESGLLRVQLGRPFLGAEGRYDAPGASSDVEDIVQVLATADLDANGVDDVIVQNTDNQVDVWFGDVDLDGSALVDSVRIAAAGSPFSAAKVADITGNGELDVLLVVGGALFAVQNNGNKSFTLDITPTTDQTPALSDFVLFDFTGDEVLDIALVSNDFESLYLFQGRHAPVNNGPLFSLITEFGTSGQVQQLIAADLTNDGTTDLGLLFKQPERLEIRPGLRLAGSVQPIFLSLDITQDINSGGIPDAAGDTARVQLVDFDLDGFEDLLIRPLGVPGLGVARGFDFGLGFEPPVFFDVAEFPVETVVVLDVNNDSAPDLLASFNDASIGQRIVENGSVPGAIDLSRTRDVTVAKSSPFGGATGLLTSLFVADLNGDGLLDVVSTDGDNELTYALGLGLQPGNGCELPLQLHAGETAVGNTDGRPSEHFASCGGAGAPEQVHVLQVDEAGPVALRITASEDAVVYVRGTCGDVSTEIGCARVDDNAGTPDLIFDAEPGVYFVFVDGAERDQDLEFSLDSESKGTTPRLTWACLDGLDNDGSGLADYPDDPGCASVQAESEALAQCRNGIDDDGDGLPDYPDDPGCQPFGRGDDDESDDAGQCGNGLDDDGDGQTDYAEDIDCMFGGGQETSACAGGRPLIPLVDNTEVVGTLTGGGVGDCVGRPNESADMYVLTVESERDYRFLLSSTNSDARLEVRTGCGQNDATVRCSVLPAEQIDVEGIPRGRYVVWVIGPEGAEYTLEAVAAVGAGDACSAGACPPGYGCRGAPAGECVPVCSDGVDNDGDGLTDFPADSGCATPVDTDETRPGGPTECEDNIDNDRNGTTDLADPGCDDVRDPIEAAADCVDPIVGNIPQGVVPANGELVGTTTADQGVLLAGSCGGNANAEFVAVYDAPFSGRLVATTDNPGTAFDTVLWIVSECGDGLRTTEVACNDDKQGATNRFTSLVQADVTPGRYYIVVDGFRAGEEGAFELSVDLLLSEGSPCDTTLLGQYPCADGLTCVVRAGTQGVCEDDTVADVPRCANGIDDDGDGLTDFPEDPGCELRSDNLEDDPPAPRACSDGVDNDADGRTDFPFDPGCTSGTDSDESEPVCSDGVDNDGDGLTDFPFDPGCVTPTGGDETDPGTLPECGDGVDNDGDGTTDFPADSDCISAGSGPEGPLDATCGTHDVTDISDDGEFTGVTTDGPAEFSGTCAPTQAPERVFTYRVETTTDLRVSLDSASTDFDTVLYIRNGCDGASTLLGCNDDKPGATQRLTSELTLNGAVPGTYFIFVDGYAENNGNFALTVREVRPFGAPCHPDDPRIVCAAGAACSADGESFVCAPSQCADGLDNDGDFAADFPNDPECDSISDNSEARSACDDGIDNDGDGLVDLEDPGCVDGDDTDEANGACADGVDNDGDGLTDFPNEPGCESPRDTDEQDPLRPPACSDGDDNDGDTLADFGQDRECESAADNVEGFDYCDGTIWTNGFDLRDIRDFRITTEPGVDRGGESCGGEGSPEQVLFYRLERRATLEIDTDRPETDFDTILYLRSDCTDPATTIACVDDSETSTRAVLRAPDLEPGGYFIFLDGYAGAFGLADVAIREIVRLGEACDPEQGVLCAEGQACVDDGSGTRVCDAPVCSDGVDNDGDGATDFPDDDGCDSPDGESEVVPACRNGVDDDGDGVTDFPDELGCESPDDVDEQNPACSDGVDNDGDGATDFPADQGCLSLRDANEVNPACVDGVDNDGDGLTDLPTDPGCSGPDDDDEADPAEAPGCSDGLDNDGDGLTDFPADLGCAFAGTAVESGECGVDKLVQVVEVPAVVNGSTESELDTLATTCVSSAAPESVVGFRLENAARVRVSTNHPGTDYDTALALRRSCLDPNEELACNDDVPGVLQSSLEVDLSPGRYFAIVDGFGSNRGRFELHIDLVSTAGGPCDPENGLVCPAGRACVDSGGGGRTCLADCFDGADNDGDGLADFPLDPGCASPTDSDESDAAVPTCSNGIDDDGDGLTDYPFDPGCEGAGSDSEADPATAPACSNGADDDGDGALDFPEDPGCLSASATSEIDPDEPPVCSDGVDQDGGGDADWPADPSCLAAGWHTEGPAFPGDACGPNGPATQITENGSVTVPVTGLAGPAWPGCGVDGAPGRVVFALQKVTEGGLLQVRVEAPNLATVGIASDCPAAQTFGCIDTPGFDFPGAPAGLYYLIVETSEAPSEVTVTTSMFLESGDACAPATLPNAPCPEGEVCASRDGAALSCEAAAQDFDCEGVGGWVMERDRRYTLSLVGESRSNTDQCSASGPQAQGNGPEHIFFYEHQDVGLTFEVSTALPDGPTDADTVLYLRRDVCELTGAHVGCNDDVGNDDPDGPRAASRVSPAEPAPGDYYIFVDTFAAGSANGKTIEVELRQTFPEGDLVRINELYFDQPGADRFQVFTELYGKPGMDLHGYSLQGVNGGDLQPYRTLVFDRANGTTIIPEDGLFVVARVLAANNLMQQRDYIADIDWQNGPDQVQLINPDGVVVDSVTYGGLIQGLGSEGVPVGSSEAGQSLTRDADHLDTDRNFFDFSVSDDPSPGVP